MKTALILLAAAIPALAQQNFDFKLLDKLGANAKGSTNISLDSNMLKLASGFLGDDKGAQSVVKNLKGVYIRGFEFDKPGQYDAADLAPLRTYLNTPQWSKIVDVKDEKEDSQIYIQALPNDQLGGLVIVSAEPKEVTVVFIAGVLNRSDVGKLSGNLGIPDIKLDHGGKKSDNSKKD